MINAAASEYALTDIFFKRWTFYETAWLLLVKLFTKAILRLVEIYAFATDETK